MLHLDLTKIDTVAEFRELYVKGGAIYFAYIEAMELPDSPFMSIGDRLERKKAVIDSCERLVKDIHSMYLVHNYIDESVVEGTAYKKAVERYKQLFQFDEDEKTLMMLRENKAFTIKHIENIQSGLVPYGVLSNSDDGLDLDDEDSDDESEGAKKPIFGMVSSKTYTPIAWLKEATEFISLIDTKIAEVQARVQEKKNKRNANGAMKDGKTEGRYAFKNMA